MSPSKLAIPAFADLDAQAPRRRDSTPLRALYATGLPTPAIRRSSITIPFDRYGRLMPGNHEQSAALLDAYLAQRISGRGMTFAACFRRHLGGLGQQQPGADDATG